MRVARLDGKLRVPLDDAGRGVINDECFDVSVVDFRDGISVRVFAEGRSPLIITDDVEVAFGVDARLIDRDTRALDVVGGGEIEFRRGQRGWRGLCRRGCQTSDEITPRGVCETGRAKGSLTCQGPGDRDLSGGIDAIKVASLRASVPVAVAWAPPESCPSSRLGWRKPRSCWWYQARGGRPWLRSRSWTVPRLPPTCTETLNRQFQRHRRNRRLPIQIDLPRSP